MIARPNEHERELPVGHLLEQAEFSERDCTYPWQLDLTVYRHILGKLLKYGSKGGSNITGAEYVLSEGGSTARMLTLKVELPDHPWGTPQIVVDEAGTEMLETMRTYVRAHLHLIPKRLRDSIEALVELYHPEGAGFVIRGEHIDPMTRAEYEDIDTDGALYDDWSREQWDKSIAFNTELRAEIEKILGKLPGVPG